MILSKEERLYAQKFVKQCDECAKFSLQSDMIAATIENKRGETADFLFCRSCYGIMQRRIRGDIAARQSMDKETADQLIVMFNRSITGSVAAPKFRAHVLDLEDVFIMWNTQNGLCAISGRKMDIKQAGTGGLWQPSMDRIDSNRGYERGNVHLVCWGVNYMKQDLTMKEFADWCSAVAKHKKPA